MEVDIKTIGITKTKVILSIILVFILCFTNSIESKAQMHINTKVSDSGSCKVDIPSISKAGISQYQENKPKVPDGVPKNLWPLFVKYGTKNVSAYVLAGVAKVESDFNRKCVTGVCYGLMQIHKKWEFYRFKPGESWDQAEASIRVCAEILNENYKKYGSIHKTLMVYNEGNKGNRNGTSRYSRKVMNYANKYKKSSIN